MLRDILWRQLLLPVLGVLVLSIPFILLEHWFPRRPIRLRSVLLSDSVQALAATAMTIPIGGLVYGQVINRLIDAGLLDFKPVVPIWLVIPFTMVGIDFSLYWIHRGMHSRLLWRIHRWHHSPTHLNWLSGMRASFQHSFLFFLNGAIWATAMRIPSEYLGFGAVSAVLTNNWMHTNLRWAWPRLEKVIVTPRTHSVHHSRALAHHNSNYGAFLGIWDHLFGTFVDPGKIPGELEFGIPDEVSVVRLMTGL